MKSLKLKKYKVILREDRGWMYNEKHDWHEHEEFVKAYDKNGAYHEALKLAEVYSQKFDTVVYKKDIKRVPMTYRVVAKCDPYNARKHYHGEPVIERDGATPVAWLFNYHEHLTLKEANQVLFDLACKTANRDLGSWRIAAIHLGKYASGAGCFTHDDGTRVLHDDSMTYAVEEEPVLEL